MGLTQSLRPAPQTFGPIQFSFSPHFTFEFRLSNVFLRHVGVVAVRSFAGRDGGSLEIRDHEKTYEMEEGRRGSRMGAGLSRWHIQGVQLLPRQRRRQQQHWGSEAMGRNLEFYSRVLDESSSSLPGLPRKIIYYPCYLVQQPRPTAKKLSRLHEKTWTP